MESLPDQQPEVAFAYPVRYGGTVPDDLKFASSAEDSHGMMAFGFDHSQAQAQLKATEAQKQTEQPLEYTPPQPAFEAFGFSNSMQMSAQQFMNEQPELEMGFGVGLGMQSYMTGGDPDAFDFNSNQFLPVLANQLKVGDYACELTPEEQEVIRRVEEE